MALSVESATLDLQESTSFVSTHEANPVEMDEVDYESLPTDKLSAHLLAGGAAGMMEHCAMYPVDCVKVCCKCVYVCVCVAELWRLNYWISFPF